MPSKRIIILDRVDANRTKYNFIFWADVPLAHQPLLADSTLESSFKGATTAENDAIKSGAVLERRGVLTKPDGTTNADIKAELEALWTDFQNQVTNSNKFDRYGTNLSGDGSTWGQV